jgi:hypothetical protein
VQLERDQPHVTAGAQTGRVVGIDPEGRVFVDFPRNPFGPVPAKLAVTDMAISEILTDPQRPELLLVFEDNDLSRPIIVGRVRDRLPADGLEIHLRAHRFTVEADEEIELRCGDARFRVTRDGKVIVLGNDVVSRARGRNKIKGGTVNIN